MEKLKLLRMFNICLFIIVFSLLSTSCGNFSSADSYLGNVYSKPAALTQSNIDGSKEENDDSGEISGEDNNMTEDTSEFYPEIEEIRESATSMETEPRTVIEALQTESESVTEETSEIKFEEKENKAEFVITESGKKFHRENCKIVKSIKQFASYDEAIRLGYEPCKICNPEND